MMAPPPPVTPGMKGISWGLGGWMGGGGGVMYTTVSVLTSPYTAISNALLPELAEQVVQVGAPIEHVRDAARRPAAPTSWLLLEVFRNLCAVPPRWLHTST